MSDCNTGVDWGCKAAEVVTESPGGGREAHTACPAATDRTDLREGSGALSVPEQAATKGRRLNLRFLRTVWLRGHVKEQHVSPDPDLTIESRPPGIGPIIAHQMYYRNVKEDCPYILVCLVFFCTVPCDLDDLGDVLKSQA